MFRLDPGLPALSVSISYFSKYDINIINVPKCYFLKLSVTLDVYSFYCSGDCFDIVNGLRSFLCGQFLVSAC